MLDEKEISKSRDLLTKILNIYTDLAPSIDQLSRCINNQELIPASLEKTISNNLLLLNKTQHEFMESYQSLKIGDLIPSLASLNSLLEEKYIFITAKKKALEIIEFINKLHSDKSDINDELTKEKNIINSYDLKTLSIDDCESIFEKYYLLKQAIEENDPQKKFKLIMDKLNTLFSFQIVYGLNINAINYTYDTSDVQESSSSLLEQVAQNSTSNDIDEITSQDNSNNTEQTPAEKKYTWEDLDVSEPQNIIFKISDDKMQVRVPPKQKKFSSSSFKNEMSKVLGPQKIFLMNAAFDYDGIIIENVISIFKDQDNIDKETFFTAAEKLIQSGYFKKYTLRKGLVDSYPAYYVLTPNGYKAFTTKESAAVLNKKPIKTELLVESIPDHASSLLTRILYHKSEHLMHLICPSDDYSITNNILDTNSFIRIFPVLPDGIKYAFTGIISSDPSDFAAWREYLNQLIEHIDTLVVIGMTTPHARSLFSWITKQLNQSIHEINVYYYDVDTKSYYDVNDNSPVNQLNNL